MLERTGLTAHQVEVAVWAVSDELGVKVGGARAVALAMAVARSARWPLLPWRRPARWFGVPWLADRVYAVVAANRHRLPGVTPWCTAHPGDCA